MPLFHSRETSRVCKAETNKDHLSAREASEEHLLFWHFGIGAAGCRELNLRAQGHFHLVW
jgi:hypothetical protein